MPRIDCIVETDISNTIRARQICGMFDVPPSEKCTLRWTIDANFDEKQWSVGLIVGPSGSGKSTIANHMWPEELKKEHIWKGKSVLDDFDNSLDLKEIASVCGAVGFNTIPAWLRPFRVLSNGEKFRVSLARTLLENEGIAVVDEFTSVVDRQVAKIGSHAVQKYVRKNNMKFVAVSCHSDIIDWLNPDWIINASDQSFAWRSLRQRPTLQGEIRKIKYDAWQLFAPYHYMNSSLSKAAQCYGLFINNQIVSFVGVLHRPNSAGGWKAISRVVTLPDWQGLGLAFRLINTVGSAYTALGWKFRNYPAHPAFIRSHRRSKVWKNCGQSFQGKSDNSAIAKARRKNVRTPWIFEYKGPKMSRIQARRFTSG